MSEQFEFADMSVPGRERLGEGAVLLRNWALPFEAVILRAFEEVVAAAPLRTMVTPGGLAMSVAMTNCGAVGWVSDRSGYRYQEVDPVTGRQWPAMPLSLLNFAIVAAKNAGYSAFLPDACLINCYEPGARLSLHQDKNERDFVAPIVSVSLGLSATFQFGGLTRGDSVARYTLRHCDVVVWGGASRLCFHGVLPLKDGYHETVGRKRINLTFRRAL